MFFFSFVLICESAGDIVRNCNLGRVPDSRAASLICFLGKLVLVCLECLELKLLSASFQEGIIGCTADDQLLLAKARCVGHILERNELGIVKICVVLVNLLKKCPGWPSHFSRRFKRLFLCKRVYMRRFIAEALAFLFRKSSVIDKLTIFLAETAYKVKSFHLF